MKRLLLAALSASVLTGCHSVRSERPVVVEAAGWAPAKRGALLEAKRAAIEKAMGSKLAAVTRLDRAAEIEQRIVTRADGVIVKYKVLSERENSGLYGIEIRAWVKHRTDEDENPEAFLPPPGDPKVSVKAASEGNYAQRSMAGLREGLSGRGVTVIDSDAPDLVVTIDAEVRELDGAGLEGLRSWRARAWAVARDAKTGKVVSQTSDEASAVDLAASAAAGKAAERAGLVAGHSLARNLDESLQNR